MDESIILPLRNTYAQINKYPINNLDEISIDNYYDLQGNINISGTTLFLRGSDVFYYLKKNIKTISDKDTISFINSNLLNIYWKNKKLLSFTDFNNLENAMKEPFSIFENILDSSENITQTITPIYYLQNNINPYEVFHISVKDFINIINNKKPLIIKLPKINININLQYELYDFYDYETNTIEDYMSR